MKSLPNITRLDTDKSHGWIVRVHYKGDFRRKLVSDKTFGGKRKSLEKAKELLLQFKKELVSQKPVDEYLAAILTIQMNFEEGFVKFGRMLRKSLL